MPDFEVGPTCMVVNQLIAIHFGGCMVSASHSCFLAPKLEKLTALTLGSIGILFVSDLHFVYWPTYFCVLDI